MKSQLSKLGEIALSEIMGADTPELLESLRVKYLGKKGELTAILRQMSGLSAEERPIIGTLANNLREKIEAAIEENRAAINAAVLQKKLRSEALDVTMPATEPIIGVRHPMSIVVDEIKDIFIGMGFRIYDGPEIEMSTYNFDRLNTPATHPAREWTDTFYLDNESKTLLRTHTSPMQARVMETVSPPICAAVFGRCYRKDEVDATHSPMFHQMEGLVIDEGITFADLKTLLHDMAVAMYGENTATRFRPHHFPFTEPSCEMDVLCHECGGKGCRVCKGEGWIELLGAGVCNPRILEMSGIDPEKYSGWAFGMGLERAAMRRFKISDLRLMFDNDIRFLEMFK